ncbi:LamG-like jellyroll fold domain-containing protein [Hymenobacter sp. BT770]|uniref:LamG-like jellyroll fold domain-containing protein n=1 Tax=Hymenobacter sp. BT770 TaxID=2886942 RepID=UPI001D1280A3|nr:LamG-like jellyroll fold domain-containing protein [Hymenobacter sp. BT770]MCC3152202.1 gliding motility-associated C-terminal domain-containing protein [Hymenobacter sp. BT770]MDO3414016.1 LamG-like jellyroll fold domain-containing protein [Hymenobacter sp. BT770]
MLALPAYSTALRFLRIYQAFALLLFLALGLPCQQALAQAVSLPGSGNSLLFNGTSSYVDCGPTNREIRQTLNVSAWVKTQSSAYQGIVSKFSDGGAVDKGFYLFTSGGKAGFSGRNGSGQLLSSGFSTSRIDDGRWHHVAGTCNQNTWLIIVDGILENLGTYSGASAGLASSAPLLIGCDYVPNGHFFSGEIDEVLIGLYPWNQYDIQQRMCSKYTTAPPALCFNYRFDLSSGTTLVDNGSRPADGVLINFGSNPWRTSGAPIGDVSMAVYQDVWTPLNRRWQITSVEGDTIFIDNISAPTRGVHIYCVNEAPSIAPAGPAAATYFGVFTVGDPSTSSYSLRISPATGPACRNAYTRLSNEMQWTLPVQLATTATSLLVPTTLYRSEHILTESVGVTAAITGDSVVCTGGRTQLGVMAPGSSSILWNTGASTATLANVVPGTYTVRVSYPSGCSRMLRRTVRAAAVPAMAISGDSSLCIGKNTALTASAAGATAYRWSTGATTPILLVAQPGVYSVTATFGPGCTTTARREVRMNAAMPPAFTLGVDTTLCEGDQLLLQGPAGPGLRYQWSDGSTGRQLLARAAGYYTLLVLTACGEQRAERTISQNSCVKVPNIITVNADTRNDRFAVQGLKGEGWALDIYNRWGRAVFRTANYHNDWGSDAAPGLYYVLLRHPATKYLYKGWLEVLR